MDTKKIKLLLCNPKIFKKEQLKRIEDFFCVVYFENDDQPLLDKSLFDSEIIICNRLFSKTDIEAFSNLKLVLLTSVGMDRFPVEKATNLGIVFHNIAGCYDIPISEFILSSVLSVLKETKQSYDNQRKHLWIKNFYLPELYNKKIGIIGFGRIGKRTANLFKAFGCYIIGFDTFINDENYTIADEFYTQVFPAVEDCDIVLLTCSLNEHSKHMVDYYFLSRLKDDAILVNTSRGAVIKTDDLVDYLLNSRKKQKFILDVFENEPLPIDDLLWDFDNVFISSHSSYCSENNENRRFSIVWAYLLDYLNTRQTKN